MRGGERVLEALCELYPRADLFTLVAFPERLSPLLRARFQQRGTTSFVQSLPAVRARYRYYLPLFPRAIESFDLSSYDLVLSSSHCVAKGARAAPHATHVSYVHTPMRYAWGTLDQYVAGEGAAAAAMRATLRAAMAPMRRWDRDATQRADALVANSHEVRARIERCYGRLARVVYPPVDTGRFAVGPPLSSRDDVYLVVSALVPYKRIDVAVRAATLAGARLIVAGEGPERARLEKLAAGNPRIVFRGRVSDEEAARLYATSRALLFPGIEDFGIVPVEAMAAGTPVLAMRAGGALETVVGIGEEAAIFEQPGAKPARDGGLPIDRGSPTEPARKEPTGLFFEEQTAASLADALARFERHAAANDFSPAALRRHAERFAKPRFLRELSAAIDEVVEGASA